MHDVVEQDPISRESACEHAAGGPLRMRSIAERRGRWRPAVPPNALVAGAPAGIGAAAIVALGFTAMLASQPASLFGLRSSSTT
jgi:hypothetical protein